MGVLVKTSVALPGGRQVDAGIDSMGGLHIEYPNGKGWTIQSDGKITNAILRTDHDVKQLGEAGMPSNPKALYQDALAVLKTLAADTDQHKLQPYQIEGIETLKTSIGEKLAPSGLKHQVANP